MDSAPRSKTSASKSVPFRRSSNGCADARQALASVRQGYDRAADSFDQWAWCRFWERNEAPVVRSWVRSLSPGSGLNAGCGTGTYTGLLSAARHECVDLDLSASMLGVLRQKYGASAQRPLLAQADVQGLPFREGQFDWLLCTRVLSHVPDAESALEEFARVLRRGGRFLLTDVHPLHPYRCTSVETATGTVPIRTYKHSLERLSQLVEQRGFSVRRLHEYRSEELPWQPRAVVPFNKLFTNNDALVFYCMELRKR